MRWKMPNVAIVAVAAVVLSMLVSAETVLSVGGGGGGGGGRQRGAPAAAADRHQDINDGNDKFPKTPAAVPCSNCIDHLGLRTLSIELIKINILSKLGMQRPPEFGGRRPPKVPTDLPPLQDLMRRYNNEHSDSVMVMPHIRHKSHHYEASGDGNSGYGSSDMQSDEAFMNVGATTATFADSTNNYNGDDEVDDYHVKTHKLIAFAQPHPITPKLRGHYLLYFTLSEQTGQHRITEAILWLHRRRSDLDPEEPVVVIEIYRINPVTMHQSFVSSTKRALNITESGWIAIDLQRRMSDWFKTSNGAKNLTLMVNAFYPTKNMTHARIPFVTDARKRDDMTEIPYLEVHTEDERRSRPKRNVLGQDCDENSDEQLCCRYPLTVDFEEFGWDWIIAPKKYEANYCSGECPLEFLQKYPHTHLAQLTNKTGTFPGTGPCCAPRKLSAISMLYFDEDSNIIYGLLPGMVVNKCGCS